LEESGGTFLPPIGNKWTRLVMMLPPVGSICNYLALCAGISAMFSKQWCVRYHWTVMQNTNLSIPNFRCFSDVFGSWLCRSSSISYLVMPGFLPIYQFEIEILRNILMMSVLEPGNCVNFIKHKCWG
jgi:hypothetical protein